MKMKRSVHRLVFGFVIGVLMSTISVLSLATASQAQVGIGISVRVGPPALPVYAQPLCPGPGYFWTPGYWAWSDDGGYYWVPGTWVVAPVGMLWTPDPINKPGDALVRSGTAMSGYLASSLWKEFQPDVMRLVSKLFKRAPQPALPNRNKK